MAEQVVIQKEPAGVEAPVVEQQGDRPEGLPEKFQSWEDMAKSYAELESEAGKLRSQLKENKDADEGGDQEENLEIPEGDDAQKAVENAGLDFDALTSEFQQSGKLSDETYEALENAGIPKGVVDSYIEGQQLKAESIRNATFEQVGGEDKFNVMRDWAAQNYTPEQKDAFNKAINGTAEERSMALNTLSTRYSDANGSEPDLLTGDNVSSGSSGAKYLSRAQLVADMQSKAYQTDPAFRAEVEAKLARSDIF